MKPWAFKVRGGGNATGIKGGPVKAGQAGGVGALCSQDRVFTIATHPDQWIATPPLTHNQYEYHQPSMSTPQVPLRYLSVCSGMEAASVAWHPLGWTPVGFSEIEPFPCAILKHRFPTIPNYGSLTEYQSWPIERGAIDLLVGGTPCQSFSVAGLRKGLADPRGNLALTFLGLADKLKPRWIVWENVPGVLSSGGGRDFGSFLGALVELGYGFAYRVLDAQYFGVPQRRRRVFVVACLGDWRAAAEVLSLREGLRGYLETGNKKRKGVAADAGAGVEAGGLPRTVGTICADTHPEAYTGQDAYTGRLIPAINPATNVQPYTASSFAQYAEGVGTVRASGGDLGGDLGGGSETLLAQSIPFRKSKRAQSTTDDESWVEANASNTLKNFDLGDTRTTHAVVEPMAFDGYNQTLSETSQTIRADKSDGDHVGMVLHTMPGSVAPTIGASGPPYSRTGNERVEAEALAVTSFQPHIVQASELRLRGQITEKSICPTLTAGAKQGDTDPLAVHAVTFQPGNLRREAGADPSFTTTTTLKASAGDQTPHVAYPPMAVRRLTPNECYRLQGFPDNWGNIPWKGKPEGQAPDGPQYKAAGNSMAVPCMFWIGSRIAAVDATLSQNHETK